MDNITILPLVKACIKQFLSFYDARIDVDGIVDNLTLVADEAISPEEILHQAFAKIEYDSDIAQLNLEQIDECELPVILFNEAEIFIHMPKHTHDGALYRVGVGKIDEELSDLYGEDAVFTSLLVSPPLETKSNGLKDLKNTIKSFKTYDWFWKELLHYRPHLVEIGLCTLFMNFFALALPLYTMNIYDRVVVSFAESTLFALTLGIFIVIIFDFLFKFIRSYALESISSKLSVKFDMNLMERILRIRKQHMELSVGELSNMFRELQGVKNFFTIAFLTTVMDLPFFFLFTLIIYIISPLVVLVPVIGAIIVIVTNLAGYRLVEQSTSKHLSVLQDKSKMMIEMLSGVEAIQSSGLLGNRLLKWKRFSSNSASLLRKHSVIMAFISGLSGAVTYLVQVIVVFVGVYQINAGNLTIGGLIACSILSGRAMAPVMRLPDLASSTRKSLEVLKITHKIFDFPDGEDHSLSPKGPFSGAIQVRDVSFQYAKQPRPALQNISIQVNPSEKVGIIGMSGAGKTTLANLMTGMIAPSLGEIMIDDYLLNVIPRTELKRTIGYLPQTPSFFEGTIRENILMGRDITDDELEHVMSISGLQEVIKNTATGLDAEVEPMGGNLSPGQKQTIAVARALLGDPEIIVFDEPTTGMDTMLENIMQTHIKPFVKDKTFIVITHKTTLLPLVDRLIVLNQGKVVADGARDIVLKQITQKTS